MMIDRGSVVNLPIIQLDKHLAKAVAPSQNQSHALPSFPGFYWDRIQIAWPSQHRSSILMMQPQSLIFVKVAPMIQA